MKTKLMRACAAGVVLLPFVGGAEGDIEARLKAQEARFAELEAQLATLKAQAAGGGGLSAGIGSALDGIQIHGSVSQGFAWCDANHKYLTLDTDRGTFAWTDMTLAVSKQISERLRVGIQLYNRIFGDVGQHQFELDYANLDYRLNQYLGFKAGRSKTRFGLYNDTQDQDALHPWALAPFSVYDPSNRALMLNHDGFDLYGALDLPAIGTLKYNVWGGASQLMQTEALALSITADGSEVSESTIQYIAGADGQLLLGGPLSGLRLGGSFMQVEFDQTTRGFQTLPFFGFPVPPALVTPYEVDNETTSPMRMTGVYAEYEWEDLKLAAEWKYIDSHIKITFRYPGFFIPLVLDTEQKSIGYYGLAAYRWGFCGLDWLQTSAYYSAYISDKREGWNNPGNYMRDLAGTVRIDVNEHWYWKFEAHDMHGWQPMSGGPTAALNPFAAQPQRSEHWFLAAVKTGVAF